MGALDRTRSPLTVHHLVLLSRGREWEGEWNHPDKTGSFLYCSVRRVRRTRQEQDEQGSEGEVKEEPD